MNALFVDTGVWVAYLNPADMNHAQDVRWMDHSGRGAVTTWPIVSETLTLLSRHVDSQLVVAAGKQFVAQQMARVLDLTTRDYALAWDIFLNYAQRRLSAADATACAIVRRLQIPTVATFDEDSRILLPDRVMLGQL